MGGWKYLRWLGGVFVFLGLVVWLLLFIGDKTGTYPFDLQNDIVLAAALIGGVFVANGIVLIVRSRRYLKKK